MVDTGDEAKGTSRFGPVRRESFWVVPLVLATLAVTGVLFLNPPEGAGIATILAVPIGIAGVVVAVLATRLTNQPQMSGGEFRGRLGLAWISFVAVLSLLAILFFTLQLVRFFWPNRDSIEYLQGRTVKIGINGRLPGWSNKSGQTFAGLDVKVARHLARELKFKDIEFVQLDPNERENALKTNRVDLVIANYSITSDRKREIDFAGPYFSDVSTIFTSNAKYKRLGSGKPTVCFTKSTTADHNNHPDYGVNDYYSVEEETLQKCMERFFNQYSVVSGIATDGTILKAYLESILSKENLSVDNHYERWGEDNTESIGVGIPNGSPALCREITDALNVFIRDKWDNSFKETLGKYKISSEGHMPQRAEITNCEDS